MRPVVLDMVAEKSAPVFAAPGTRSGSLFAPEWLAALHGLHGCAWSARPVSDNRTEPAGFLAGIAQSRGGNIQRGNIKQANSEGSLETTGRIELTNWRALAYSETYHSPASSLAGPATSSRRLSTRVRHGASCCLRQKTGPARAHGTLASPNPGWRHGRAATGRDRSCDWTRGFQRREGLRREAIPPGKETFACEDRRAAGGSTVNSHPAGLTGQRTTRQRQRAAGTRPTNRPPRCETASRQHGFECTSVDWAPRVRRDWQPECTADRAGSVRGKDGRPIRIVGMNHLAVADVGVLSV